jgi:prepilin-type N-terminal cleavage/methylation domain-containing protein
MRTNRRTLGFTIIELLVVIAIIGLLIALLIPAVQSARESARRTQCKNNLRQLGIAIHSYHEIHKLVPINYGSGYYDATNSGSSWLQQILPFVDQTNLHDLINFGKPIADLDNELAAKTSVNVFLCPSDANGVGVMGNRCNVGHFSLIPRGVSVSMRSELRRCTIGFRLT